MKIKTLKIHNFRGIDKMDLDLDPRLNVFMGINGVGKSTILDTIAIQLSWIIARIRQDKGSGNQIKEKDIKNDRDFSKVFMTIESQNLIYPGLLAKNKRGKTGSETRSDMNGFTHYAQTIKKNIIKNEDASAPVFIYYGVQRAVTEIPLRIRGNQESFIVKSYDNSLNSGSTFRSFFAWYRNREDLENQLLREQGQLIEDKQLAAVRSAIKKISGFENISIKRSPLQMEISKNYKKLSVDQLSDGEKCLFAMAGDMARRLCLANPTKQDSLNGEGIVLIDEVELHLHPQWQKKIIEKLMDTFPNIQFIISTHSPQVLCEIEGKKIYSLYKSDDEGISFYNPDQGKGLNSNEILEELMKTVPVSDEIKKRLDVIFELIDDKFYDKAKNEIDLFEIDYGSIPELVKAETLLAFYKNGDS